MSAQLAAQWVTAIGSAGSLLGFASYVWIMLLNRRDEAEVRQEQAAQSVAAWMDKGEYYDHDGWLVLCVYNGGAAPVFNAHLRFSLQNSEDDHETTLAIVPPGRTAPKDLPFRQDQVDEQELYSAPAVPELRFTDSLGTDWKRDKGGQVERVGGAKLRRRPRLRK